MFLGGEAGRAVCAALRSVDVRVGDAASGEEVLRRIDSGGVDVGDDDGEREWARGSAPGLVDVRTMGALLDTTRDLGDTGGEIEARIPGDEGDLSRGLRGGELARA